MRYFLHVEGHNRDSENKRGKQFATLEEALVQARTISDELTFEGEYHGYKVNVVDAQGNLVDTVPIPVRLH